MKQKAKVYQLGELFSGPGGIGLGAKQAKLITNSEAISIHTTWANDFDTDSCKTYETNLNYDCSATVISKDVHDLDICSLPLIDGLAFGFPCNDFSIVGEKHGFNGKFGPLYTFVVKVLKQHQYF